MDTPDEGAVTDWLIATLELDASGAQVGDHGPPVSPRFPFWVVWHVPGGALYGPPLGAAIADADLVFQVDSVGKTRKQAQLLARRARALIAAPTVNGVLQPAAAQPSGLSIRGRMPEGPVGSPLPEGDRPNEVYTSSERFVISVTPA